MRRVGKTSVVKAATYGKLRIYIDARYFEEKRYISYGDLLEALRKELRRLLPLHKRLGELLSKIRGVSVAGVDVKFEIGRKLAPALLNCYYKCRPSNPQRQYCPPPVLPRFSRPLTSGHANRERG